MKHLRILLFLFATSAFAQDSLPLRDIHFAFGSAAIDALNQNSVEADAVWLITHPKVRVTLEGDADVRGNIVYNLALSQKRADAVRAALLKLGVPPEQIVHAVGWGKLYQVTFATGDCIVIQGERGKVGVYCKNVTPIPPSSSRGRELNRRVTIAQW